MAEMTKKPKTRSELRNKLGYIYYGTLRRLSWVRSHRSFAREQAEEKLAYSYFSHKTLLRRKLRNVDMWMQEKVFEVINARYIEQKPIIFTANYSLKELIEERGIAKRTVDRIMEMCEVIRLDGASYRIVAMKNREKLF